jgi:hypothetical protein
MNSTEVGWSKSPTTVLNVPSPFTFTRRPVFSAAGAPAGPAPQSLLTTNCATGSSPSTKSLVAADTPGGMKTARCDVNDGSKPALIPHRYCIYANSQPSVPLAGIAQSFPSLVSESVRTTSAPNHPPPFESQLAPVALENANIFNLIRVAILGLFSGWVFFFGRLRRGGGRVWTHPPSPHNGLACYVHGKGRSGPQRILFKDGHAEAVDLSHFSRSSAVWDPEKAVLDAVGINIGSHDFALCVYRIDLGFARAWYVNCRKDAFA